jgi:hypothetical protein
MPILIRFLVFTLVALTVSAGSAALMLDRGFFATARQAGPWITWFNAGLAGADPYTLARVARSGDLPVTAASMLSFTAADDSDGRKLRGDCTYEIVGRQFPALWWNIAAFTPAGRAIPNKAGRHAFNSANLLLTADGLFSVRLGPDVQPGNWLPTSPDEGVVLQINILRPLNRDRVVRDPRASELMPRITRMGCS